jgi:predicted HD phosphohydrolase
MSAAEIAAFEGERYFAQAVRIRRWDDSGKIAGLVTPRLTDYRGLVTALAAR